MNFNFYIYGTPGGNYSQWPEDYTSELLRPQCENIQGTRALIHRKGNLFIYVLTERMEDGNTMGIALSVNGVQTTSPLALFALLHQVLDETIPTHGKLLRYNDNGQLLFAVGHLSEATEECCWIGEMLGQKLDEYSNTISFTPPSVAYDGSDTYAEVLLDSADNSALLRLTDHNNTVVLLSDAGMARNYMAELIASQRAKIVELEQACSTKDDELKKIVHQKNQYRIVIILALMMLIGTIVAALLISQKSDKIESQSEQITRQNANIEQKEQFIGRLRDSLISYKTELLKMKTRWDVVVNSQSHTGALCSRASDSYDAEYVMWIKASLPLSITGLKTKARHSGYVTICLYSDDSRLVANKEVYLYGGRPETVNLHNFYIEYPGNYYLRITDCGTGGLAYHGSSQEEFNNYQQGALQILGCCNYSEIDSYEARNKTNYYQYFYEIEYRLIDDK